MKKTNNLILIPVLSNTKNMPRHNLRLVNNKPLLYYILKTCIDIKHTDVFVVTDSEEIREVSLQYTPNVIHLKFFKSLDLTSSEKIIQNSLESLKKSGHEYKNCISVFSDLPLIKTSTIKKFFSKISIHTTVVGYVENSNTFKKHHFDSNLVQLSSLQNVVSARTIFGFNIETFLKNKGFHSSYHGIQLSIDEGFIAKNYHDLEQIEKILNRHKILVCVNGSKKIGLGHVYNMITVLNYLRNNDILIVMSKNQNLGNQKLRKQLYNVKLYSNNTEFDNIIRDFTPDLIFNDVLNTTVSYMKKLRKFNSFIVNFEDLGSGSNLADLVFNPIYLSNENKTRKFFGSDYACVRDEFRILKSKPIRKQVKNILLTFGGTDPQNLTLPVLELLSKNNIQQEIVVILGMGNTNKNKIKKFVSYMNKNSQNVKIIEQSDIMAKYIRESDFVITANGRTVFEIASLKVPMITISVHEREELHKFSRISGGAIHLGSINNLNMKSFQKAILQMMDYNFRKKLRMNLEKHDLLNGVHEIIKIINTKFNDQKI